MNTQLMVIDKTIEKQILYNVLVNITLAKLKEDENTPVAFLFSLKHMMD